MRNKSLVLVPLLVLLCVSLAYAQANGKLQIHFMDVGQGDGAVLISPQGEVVLFDNGVFVGAGFTKYFLPAMPSWEELLKGTALKGHASCKRDRSRDAWIFALAMLPKAEDS